MEGKMNKSIAKQLENREVPLCVICKINPAREGCKTCSKECFRAYYKAYQKAYHKAYQRAFREAVSELIKRHKKEFELIRNKNNGGRR